MVRGCLACVVVVACTSAPLSCAGAGPRAVIELFTSQGCSSCPPADKLLGQLATDPSLIAVSLPIDYWDYLGWKDTLADPRNSNRQRAYSHARGDREVYTPQVVVNGSVHALGSDKDAIQDAIALTRKNAMTLSLPVSMAVAGGQVLVTLPDGAEGHSADVWLCGLTKAITVAIGRGENRGKTITYYNVVRRWLKLGMWTGKGENWNVPVGDFDGDGVDEAALMVQSGTIEKPSSMLGAASVTLHQSDDSRIERRLRFRRSANRARTNGSGETRQTGPWRTAPTRGPSCGPTKKGRRMAGRKSVGGLNRTYQLPGPIRSKPRGAGGLRNPALVSRPGPEATVFCFAFQLGMRLFESGRHYEAIDETVRAACEFAAAVRRAEVHIVSADVNTASCPRAQVAQSSVK